MRWLCVKSDRRQDGSRLYFREQLDPPSGMACTTHCSLIVVVESPARHCPKVE